MHKPFTPLHAPQADPNRSTQNLLQSSPTAPHRFLADLVVTLLSTFQRCSDARGTRGTPTATVEK